MSFFFFSCFFIVFMWCVLFVLSMLMSMENLFFILYLSILMLILSSLLMFIVKVLMFDYCCLILFSVFFISFVSGWYIVMVMVFFIGILNFSIYLLMSKKGFLSLWILG